MINCKLWRLPNQHFWVINKYVGFLLNIFVFFKVCGSFTDLEHRYRWLLMLLILFSYSPFIIFPQLLRRILGKYHRTTLDRLGWFDTTIIKSSQRTSVISYPQTYTLLTFNINNSTSIDLKGNLSSSLLIQGGLMIKIPQSNHFSLRHPCISWIIRHDQSLWNQVRQRSTLSLDLWNLGHKCDLLLIVLQWRLVILKSGFWYLL